MKHLLCLSLILLGLSYSQKKPKPRTSDRPNILFIMADDHTAQAWGIYGGILGGYVKNDHIKWLAAHGVVLKQCLLYQLNLRAQPGVYSHRPVQSPQRCVRSE